MKKLLLSLIVSFLSTHAFGMGSMPQGTLSGLGPPILLWSNSGTAGGSDTPHCVGSSTAGFFVANPGSVVTSVVPRIANNGSLASGIFWCSVAQIDPSSYNSYSGTDGWSCRPELDIVPNSTSTSVSNASIGGSWTYTTLSQSTPVTLPVSNPANYYYLVCDDTTEACSGSYISWERNGVSSMGYYGEDVANYWNGGTKSTSFEMSIYGYPSGPVPPAPACCDATTTAYEARVTADGGTVVSESDIDAFVQSAKRYGYWWKLADAYSPTFGVKKDGSGNVSKLYGINGNDATAISGHYPVWTAAQRNGRATLSFDGSTQYLTTPLYPTASAGYFATVYPTANPAGLQATMGAAGSSSTYSYAGLYNVGGRIEVAGGVGTIPYTGLSQGTSVDWTGEWFIGGLTYDGTYTKLYANTTQILYHQAQNGSGANATYPVIIGGYNNAGTPASFFTGQVGDVLVFNSAPPVDQEVALATLQNSKYNLYQTLTVPAVTSTAIAGNGTTWTLITNDALTAGSGGSGGLAASCSSSGTVNLTYSSASWGPPTLVFTGSKTVQYGETCTLGYTQPGNGWTDVLGASLASFSGASVTNNTNPPGVTYVAGSSSNWANSTSSGVTSYTYTSSSDGAATTMLRVAISYKTDTDPTAVKVNGTTITHYSYDGGTNYHYHGTSNCGVDVWYMMAPPSGTPTIEVDYGATPTNTGRIGVDLWTNVNATTPLGTAVVASAGHDTVTVPANGAAVDIAARYNSFLGSANNSQLWSQSLYYSGASMYSVNAGSQLFKWGVAGTGDAIMVIPINH